METFSQRHAALLEEIQLLPDPQERLGLLMERSLSLPPLPAEYRTDAYRVVGCVSQVWLRCESSNGAIFYDVDADSPMVKALAALYRDLYNGLSRDEILTGKNTLLQDSGIAQRLSGTRLHGMAALDARIKQLALESP